MLLMIVFLANVVIFLPSFSLCHYISICQISVTLMLKDHEGAYKSSQHYYTLSIDLESILAQAFTLFVSKRVCWQARFTVSSTIILSLRIISSVYKQGPVKVFQLVYLIILSSLFIFATNIYIYVLEWFANLAERKHHYYRERERERIRVCWIFFLSR